MLRGVFVETNRTVFQMLQLSAPLTGIRNTSILTDELYLFSIALLPIVKYSAQE